IPFEIDARASNTGSHASSSSSLLLSTLTSLSFPLSLASILVVTPLNIFWSNQLMAFCFTIVVSSYSNNYEIVTAIVAVIC
ncbi:unnamed protein product, partial [Hymenolepis diminuta]